ncbi:hypothetical protein [Nonomuraea insulae]|uniref:Uncharacterized protein n=1 Tax=Nonomuraea insulae TaxID=1616787 RepID=A0ABW1D2P1_9ACTN
MEPHDRQRQLEIDELIRAGANIQALEHIRTAYDCTLHEAVDLLNERWTQVHHGDQAD